MLLFKPLYPFGDPELPKALIADVKEQVHLDFHLPFKLAIQCIQIYLSASFVLLVLVFIAWVIMLRCWIESGGAVLTGDLLVLLL